MRVLFVSVEVSPFAKVGGLADVIGSLPKAVRALGHDARVIMPLYRMIEEDPRWDLKAPIEDFDVEINPHWHKKAIYRETEWEGVPISFIGTDEWFPNAVDSSTVYQPGGMQHLFFSKAVIQAVEKLGWFPDVMHCHDWHTGFLPVLIREQAGEDWDEVSTVYTIHNHAYQGDFDIDVLDTLGLPRSLFTSEKVEAWGRVNFLKAGMVYSDRVNTVSETYAKEIQTPEYGETLEGLMVHLKEEGRLSGIVNGIDTDQFNPETDPDLAGHFSAADPSGKAACREDLLHELGLTAIPGCPVVGMISRLSTQKGYDMVIEAAHAMMSLPIQLVVLGLGDPQIAKGLRDLQKKYPKNVRFIEEFAPVMAQKIYAGVDAFLMPSAFEPCGLGQLIAMRYGSIPVVRATGGLADTVFEGKNGFVFQKKEPMDMLAAVERMHDTFQQPEQWANLMHNALSGDYGWAKSAVKYAALYRAAVANRPSNERTA